MAPYFEEKGLPLFLFEMKFVALLAIVVALPSKFREKDNKFGWNSSLRGGKATALASDDMEAFGLPEDLTNPETGFKDMAAMPQRREADEINDSDSTDQYEAPEDIVTDPKRDAAIDARVDASLAYID